MPKFQRRHYIAISEVIADARTTGHANLFPELDQTVYTLAALFAIDNPAFDRARFLQACGNPAEPTPAKRHTK